MTSFQLNRWPKRNMPTWNMREANQTDPSADATRTAKLTSTCQAGTEVNAQRMVSVRGAVRGKKVSNNDTRLLGWDRRMKDSMAGSTDGKVTMVANCWASRRSVVMAPTPANSPAVRK